MYDAFLVIIWFISDNLRFFIELVKFIKTSVKEKIRRVFRDLAD